MKTYHCKVCGTDKVVWDAWASWNSDTNEFELNNTFDHCHCTICDGQTTAYLREDKVIESFGCIYKDNMTYAEAFRVYVDDNPTDEFFYRVDKAYVEKEYYIMMLENFKKQNFLYKMIEE